MQGKTLILGSFCAEHGILYPGCKIAVCSKTLDQARETFNKIREFLANSPNLANEIESFPDSKTVNMIKFKNGSTIKIYPVSDNARGGRSHITIVDEYFFCDRQKYVEVIVPFQSGKRITGFSKKKQWEDMKCVEENKTIYTTSSVMQAHWGYEEYCKFTRKMLNGEKYCSFALPAQVNILNGFTTVEKLKETKLNYTAYKWDTEMMACFPGMSEDAFFDFGKLNNGRVLKCVYPKYMYEYLDKKSKMKFIHKENGEIRLVSCDIALMAGRKNDKSVYSVIRLIPSRDGYKRQVCYMESHEGMLTKKQSMRINRLFYEFDCDYIVIDGQGNGQPIIDGMMDYLTDDETGETYPPLDCINNEEVSQRCIHRDARKVIYCIKARPEFNDECYCGLKNTIENGKLELLNCLEEGQTFLANVKGYNDLPTDKQAMFEKPYQEINDLIDEMTNIEVDKDVLLKTNKVKLREKSGSTKDHMTSIAYGNYIASELEIEYLKKLNEKQSSFKDFFIGSNNFGGSNEWIESYY